MVFIYFYPSYSPVIIMYNGISISLFKVTVMGPRLDEISCQVITMTGRSDEEKKKSIDDVERSYLPILSPELSLQLMDGIAFRH